MKQLILVVQIVVGLALVGLILLQGKGGGLGATFGASGGVYQSKRGVEKIIFLATIVAAVLFLALSVANVS